MRWKLRVEITFKQNKVLLLEIGWPLISCKSIDKLMLIIIHHLSYFEFAITLNKMKSWGHMA